MKSSHQILVTRSLSPEQIRFANELNLSVKVEPAIEIRYRDQWDDIKHLMKRPNSSILAFTSQSGVKAFRRYLLKTGDSKPNPETGTAPEPVFDSGSGRHAYAVGDKTAEALINIGYIPITPEQHDGTGLAKLIRDHVSAEPNGTKKTVLHFCGNRRRDEFRQFLEGSGIQVRDVVVYQTVLKQMNLDLAGMDAILFYSPSAVQAFRNSGGFNIGSLPELFAIGQTTGRELSIESGKPVHISPKANTKSFLTYVNQILSE